MEIQNVLVFDVETTGLLPRATSTKRKFSESSESSESNPITENLDDYPFITQLSFALYDIIQKKILRSYNAYVRLEPHIVVPSKITEITGITREFLDENGQNILDVLIEFYIAYLECDAVVAHNFEFDTRMVLTEVKRNYATLLPEIRPHILWMFNPMYCKATYVLLHCTMKSNIERCNIKRKTATGREFTKFPKLSELYDLLFHSVPDKLHNSMIDVLACLRCYLKTEFDIDISDKVFDAYCRSCVGPCHVFAPAPPPKVTPCVATSLETSVVAVASTVTTSELFIGPTLIET